MKIFITALIFITLLSGCASTEYKQYVESQVAIQTAKSNAEEAKYKAMADIAQSGDTTTKVAAMMALQTNTSSTTLAIQSPKTLSETARDWMSLLVPSLIQGYGIHANTQMGMKQSDNATTLGVSTNNAFVGMAGHIQAPAANVSIVDSHNSASDNHSTNGSYNPSPTDNSNQGNSIPTPTPVTP